MQSAHARESLYNGPRFIAVVTVIRYPQKFPPRGVAKYRGIVTRGCQIIPAAACISLASMAESLSDCSMDLESAEEEIEIESEGAENARRARLTLSIMSTGMKKLL